MKLLDSIRHLFHPQRSNNHRPRLLHVESIISLTGIVAGFALFIVLSSKINPHVGYILGYASNISVEEVVQQTNQVRTADGLSALTYNEQLSGAARAKAADMFAKQYWAHRAPDGREPWAFISESGYFYAAAGENLARDFMTTSDMVAAWMASPTHKANIMNGRYQEIGVAVVNGTLEGIETTLVVQMFGRPTAQAVAARVTPAAATFDATPAPVALDAAQSSPVTVALTVNSAPDQPSPELANEQESLTQPVLARTAVTGGALSAQVGAFSPTELAKAFSLGLLLILVVTLVYDWYVAHTNGTVRLVGKNLAHIMYLLAVAFIVLLFRGGFVF